MAILYGTQSNGETLPVLVDQFGNLLAKGIDGPPGPEGPPGLPQLPPDPLEGSLLGWQDGELAWIGGTYPLPGGTYGPFTYDGASLELPEPPPLVYLESIFMSDRDGNQITVDIETDTISSVSGNVLSFFSDKNFQNFQVGDKVEGSQIVGGNMAAIPSYQSNKPSLHAPTEANMFDRVATTVALTGIMDSGTPVIQWMFAQLSYVDHARVQYSAFDGEVQPGVTWATSAKNASIEILDESGNWVAKGTMSSGSSLYSYPVGQIAQGIRVAGRNLGLGIGNLECWAEADELPDQRITAINSNAFPPTITVSGGSWLGADGSGVSNGKTRFTRTTNGTGTVQSVVGNNVVLRADNKGWLSGNYVTAPAQSVGFASMARFAAGKFSTKRDQLR